MRLATATLLLALASPLAAQSLAGSPNQYDVAAGVGKSTSVAFSYLRMATPGTSEKFQLGLGARATLIVGELKLLPATHERAVPFSVHDTLTISVAPILVNLVGHVGWTFSEKLSAGLNVDIFGISSGGSRSGTYKENQAATPESVNAKPATINIFGFGIGDDRASLNSEFFLSWKLNDKYTLRGGLSHQRVQYNTDIAMASFTNEFETYTNLAFLGLRITP